MIGISSHSPTSPLKTSYPSRLQYIYTKYERASEKKCEVLTAKFSPDNFFLSTGYSNGSIVTCRGENGAKLFSYSHSEMTMPITALAWKPTFSFTYSGQTFKAVTADGRIMQWRAKYQDDVMTLSTNEENSYLCIDYSPYTGDQFVCAGKLHHIELFDDAKHKLITLLKGNGTGLKGHQNRIFATQFNQENGNMVASGGWDCNVNIWDIRNGKCIGSISGPLICGDAISFSKDGNTLLTGSHKWQDGLQLWDLRTLGCMKRIQWDEKEDSAHSTKIYSAKFLGPNHEFILAGGSDKDSAKIFSVENEKMIVDFKDISKSCLTVDSTSDGSLVSLGCGDGIVSVKHLLYS